MKLKFTLIGLIITLGLCYYIGNINYIRKCFDVDSNNFSKIDPCFNPGKIEKLLAWSSQDSFGQYRILVWVICVVPGVAGLIIDYKRNKKQNGLQ